MVPLSRILANITAKAVSTAFPITETASVGVSRLSSDYSSAIPTEIYNKHRIDRVAFGLFNPREIADSLFVNIEKHPCIERTEISVVGDLDFHIKNDYLLEAVNTLLRLNYLSVDYQVSKEAYVLPCDSESISLFTIRQLISADSLKRMRRVFNGEVSIEFLSYSRSFTQEILEVIYI